MNLPLEIKAEIIATIPKNKCLTLIDSSTGIIITPFHQIFKGDKKKIIYKNIWRGDFTLIFGEKSFNINSHNSGKTIFGDINLFTKHYLKIGKDNNKTSKVGLAYMKTLFGWGWNYTFKKVDKILVVCDYLRKAVKKETGRESEILPIPIDKIDLEKIKAESLKHPSVIIIQNHQIKEKSAALVDFAEVIRSLPNVTFYVSKGLPENRNNFNYQKVIDTLGILRNVRFVDVNSFNKYSYLKGADIYILATGLDCTPATILEAGLAQKPVIASRVGGVPEMVIEGKTGWTVNNGSTKDWVDKIKSLINNENLTHKMGKANKEYVISHYDLELISNRLLELIT